MSRALLPILILLCSSLLLSSRVVRADDPLPEPGAGRVAIQRTGITIEYVISVQGRESSWRVFSDGRIQRLEHPLGGSPRLKSGKLPAEVLANLLARSRAQGLDTARFTQQPEPGQPPRTSEGFVRLSVSGRVFDPPQVLEPNPQTKAICASMEAFAKDLAETCAPHLGSDLPAGTYVYVHAFTSAEERQLRELDRLGAERERVDSPALRAALETPGLLVRLAEGEAVERGRIELVQGRAVMWNTLQLSELRPSRDR